MWSDVIYIFMEQVTRYCLHDLKMFPEREMEGMMEIIT